MLTNYKPAALAEGLVHMPQQLSDPMAIIDALTPVLKQSPLRHMQTRRGFFMSAAMTYCGRYGWVSDRRGYRYQTNDPDTGKPWPEMPLMLQQLASDLSALAGYQNVQPDVCLINRYAVGAKNRIGSR